MKKNISKKEKPFWRPIWSWKYTPEKMLEKAMEYFKFCDNIDNWLWKWEYKILKPKTLSWLCLFLWVSKDYISEKAKDSTFSETIKKIRLEVENSIEEWILTNTYNPTAWIFNLKNNFDWKEKNELSIKPTELTDNDINVYEKILQNNKLLN